MAKMTDEARIEEVREIAQRLDAALAGWTVARGETTNEGDE